MSNVNSSEIAFSRRLEGLRITIPPPSIYEASQGFIHGSEIQRRPVAIPGPSRNEEPRTECCPVFFPKDPQDFLREIRMVRTPANIGKRRSPITTPMAASINFVPSGMPQQYAYPLKAMTSNSFDTRRAKESQYISSLTQVGPKLQSENMPYINGPQAEPYARVPKVSSAWPKPPPAQEVSVKSPVVQTSLPQEQACGETYVSSTDSWSGDSEFFSFNSKAKDVKGRNEVISRLATPSDSVADLDEFKRAEIEKWLEGVSPALPPQPEGNDPDCLLEPLSPNVETERGTMRRWRRKWERRSPALSNDNLYPALPVSGSESKGGIWV